MTNDSSMTMDAFESPRKRQRVDESTDGDFWDDDFTEDQLAQIDAVLSQVASQVTRPSETGTLGSCVPPSNSCRATSSCVVPETSEFLLKSGVKPWLSPSLPDPSLDLPGSSVSVEKFKHAQQAAMVAEEQLKRMTELLTKKEYEKGQVDQERNWLQQQVENLRKEQQAASKQIQRLKTQIDFMRQESSTLQWSLSEQQARENARLVKPHARENVIPVYRAAKPSPSKPAVRIKDDPKAFPTAFSFAKVLGREKLTEATTKRPSPSSPVKHTEQQCLCDAASDKSHGVETGPGLVAAMLGENSSIWSTPDCVVLNLLKRQDVPMECFSADVESLTLSKTNSTASTTNSDSASVSCATDVRFGLLRLLADDAKDGNGDQLDDHGRWAPSDMPLLKTRLGLRKDHADSLLPVIENILGSLPSARASVVSPSSANLGSLSSSNQGSAITSHSSYSGTTASSGQSANTDPCSEPSVCRVLCALHMLRTVAYYSPKVRHCLVTEFYVGDASGSSSRHDVKPECVLVEHISSSSHGDPSHALDSDSEVKDSECLKRGSRCLILTKLLRFITQLLPLEDRVLNQLLLVILDIFIAVAMYCPVENLTRFIPMLSLSPIQRCMTLAVNGAIFLQFVTLLCKLVVSTRVVESCCIQEDFCLWSLLTDTWVKAGDVLPKFTMDKLDFQMIRLLSTCLTHEEITPSFLISDECRCPFEVVSSLIIYLHRQRVIYDESGRLTSITTLQEGISLLCQVAQQDSHFADHRANTDAEFYLFLYWLPRIHKTLKLGDSAEALMEMWNISSEDSATLVGPDSQLIGALDPMKL